MHVYFPPNFFQDALPEGFSQEFEEQLPKSRPKFHSPQIEAVISTPLQPKTKKKEEYTRIKVIEELHI